MSAGTKTVPADSVLQFASDTVFKGGAGVLWDDGGIGGSAIAVTIFGFLVMPLAPAVIAGWVCGKIIRGINIAGGVTLGVLGGIAMVILQPFVLVYVRFDLDIMITPGMYLAVAGASAVLSTTACCLWALAVGRRGFWRLGEGEKPGSDSDVCRSSD